MNRAPSDEATQRRVGLCCTCRHARRIVSAKGSVFWLCERSRTDPRFRKYPPVPVVRCSGHEAPEAEGDRAGEGERD